MDLFAPRHILIILLIVLVVFGTKKLKTIGSDLGGALRGFKQAMKEGESEEHVSATSPAAPALPAQGPANTSTAAAQAAKTPPAA